MGQMPQSGLRFHPRLQPYNIKLTACPAQASTPVAPLPGDAAQEATLLPAVLARIARCLEGPSSPPLICGACKAAGAS